MSDSLVEHELIERAKSGDRVALQELLVLQFTSLTEHISREIPASFQGELAADDVIQQAFAQVVRDIKDCRAKTEESFFAWVRAIAEHRLLDAIRCIRTQKRGGNLQRVRAPLVPYESSMIQLVEMLSAGSHRPSGSAMRHEAIEAVHETIEALPEEYRRAVTLRLLDGKSLDETAAIMGRSPRAIQGLVDRAKKKMRATLGRLSRYE